MAKNEYRVLQGIDYPPNKRAEAGQIVSDLPKDSIPWLLDSGVIESLGVAKASLLLKKSVDAVSKDAMPIVIIEDAVATFEEEVADEL